MKELAIRRLAFDLTVWTISLVAGLALLAPEAMAGGDFSSARNDRWRAEAGSHHLAYPQLLPAQPSTQSPEQQAENERQIETVAADCLEGFAVPAFDSLRGKLAPRAADGSEAMLTLKDKPTRDERDALRLWVDVVALCRDTVLSTAREITPPATVAFLNAAWQMKIGKLLELHQGMISYGEYNAWERRATAL